MAPKILVVLTSHNQLGSSGKPTGWYLPELAHPYNVFVKAGAELAFASPKGGVAPLDPASVELFKEDAASQEFLKNHKEVWETTKPLSEFTNAAETYDAIFFPGGHGPMYDLATDAQSHKIIADFASKGKVVAAVCHGPAALVNVKLPDGTALLKGKQVTGFSNLEEDQVQLSAFQPFELETELGKASGGKYVKAAEPWAEYVVVSGNVITGQNPASSHKLGEEVIKALKA
ncbi:hypothetical protein SLS53_007704 [Cytospora paraplurivora]|uniref:D-lactate dehydratase n=1 Tax=Cytospora paraplurivora TaxID=2898453 RepID=A0AAN9U7F8_9PEZI